MLLLLYPPQKTFPFLLVNMTGDLGTPWFEHLSWMRTYLGTLLMILYLELSLIQDYGQHTLSLFIRDLWVLKFKVFLNDGQASHILTSHIASSVLGSLPIANECMGDCCSARTVYSILWQQYGAGDHSAVMIIEACLCQLRCLPAWGSSPSCYICRWTAQQYGFFYQPVWLCHIITKRTAWTFASQYPLLVWMHCYHWQ